MNKNSLTLLEILLSTLILALVMAGLANIFISAKKFTLHTRSRIQAAELGKLFLDPLQMQVREDLWNTNCLGTGSSSNCLNDSRTLNGIPYNAAYNITPVTGTTLRRAQVNITWNEPTP